MAKSELDRVKTYLGAVRKHYLEAFRRTLEEAKVEAGKSGRKLIIEAAASVESTQSEAEASGDGALPYRLDVVLLGKDGAVQPTTVSDDHDLAWEPAAAPFGEFLAQVEKLVWN